MSKPIICVDFDGVLHSYDSGWQGANVVNDGPVPGAMQWLADLPHHFTVCIYSSRSAQQGGIAAMRQAIYRWVQQEFDMTPPWLSELQYPTKKPSAFLTIDDRAICFEGEFDSLHPQALLEFTPWNKERKDPDRFQEGYQAYKDGLDFEDCPYDYVSIAGYYWKEGWEKAENADEPRKVKANHNAPEGDGTGPEPGPEPESSEGDSFTTPDPKKDPS